MCDEVALCLHVQTNLAPASAQKSQEELNRSCPRRCLVIPSGTFSQTTPRAPDEPQATFGSSTLPVPLLRPNGRNLSPATVLP